MNALLQVRGVVAVGNKQFYSALCRAFHSRALAINGMTRRPLLLQTAAISTQAEVEGPAARGSRWAAQGWQGHAEECGNARRCQAARGEQIGGEEPPAVHRGRTAGCTAPLRRQPGTHSPQWPALFRTSPASHFTNVTALTQGGGKERRGGKSLTRN